jgi:hypothetical protein
LAMTCLNRAVQLTPYLRQALAKANFNFENLLKPQQVEAYWDDRHLDSDEPQAS